MRAAILEVETKTVGRLLTERNGALLAPLTSNEHSLLLEIDIREPEIDCLLGPQASRVDELEEGAVT